jgi:RNA polymerase sigma-70 factor (ECF subfamily)
MTTRLQVGVVPTAPGRGEATMTGVDFDDFYRAEYPGLVALTAAILGRRSGADDLVQEAMIDAYRRWGRLAHYDAPRAWVRRVILQRAAKVDRKQRNERDAHLRSVRQGPPAQEHGAELDPELRSALTALPMQQRAVMALHYLDDLSIVEIAEALDVSEGTVKTHLSRGRLRLSSELDRPDNAAATERGDS